MSSIPLRAAVHAFEYAGWVLIPMAVGSMFLPHGDDDHGQMLTRRNGLIATAVTAAAIAGVAALHTKLSMKAASAGAETLAGGASSPALDALRGKELVRFTEDPLPRFANVVHSHVELTATPGVAMNHVGTFRGPVFEDLGADFDAAKAAAGARSSHTLVGQAQILVQPEAGGHYFVTQAAARRVGSTGAYDQAASIMPFFFSGRHTSEVTRLDPAVKAVASKHGFADLRELASVVPGTHIR